MKNMLFTLKIINRLIVMMLMRLILNHLKSFVTLTRSNFYHIRYLLRFLLQHSVNEKSDNSPSVTREVSIPY
jgi:hypothetical protein